MKKFHIFLWMIFLTFLCHTLITININVAIISMIRPPSKNTDNRNDSKFVICGNTTFAWDHLFPETIITTLDKEDTFDWSNYEKSIVLSSVHWFSWLLILPGSILSQKFGSKVVVGHSLGISALLSSLIPVIASYGAQMVVSVRVMQGLLLGLTFPGGIMTAAGNWTSVQNRGKFLAALLAGQTVATSFGIYIFGFIGKYLHWKYIFHVTSFVGTVWIILWFYLVYDFPDKHPSITIREKTKIRGKRKYEMNDGNIPIPWKDILTSIPLIVCLVDLGTVLVNSFVIVTFVPLYISTKFGFDSNQTGIIISVSRLCCAALTLPLGWFTDYFTRKRWLSITNTRKSYSVIGCMLSSTLLILMAITECNVVATLIFYTLSASLRGVFVFGLEPALVDMSPKFCGVTHGLSGTINELMTMVFSVVIGYFSKTLPPEEYWRLVFLLTAALPVIPTILFTIWGSAERQSWDQGLKTVPYNNQNINDNSNREDQENEMQRMNNGK